MRQFLLKCHTFCWVAAGLLAVAVGPGRLLGLGDLSPGDRVAGGVACLLMARRSDRIAQRPPPRPRPSPPSPAVPAPAPLPDPPPAVGRLTPETIAGFAAASAAARLARELTPPERSALVAAVTGDVLAAVRSHPAHR